MTEKITVETLASAPRAKVWACYTEPEHIVEWNFASSDWHCPKATNDLRVGGKFVSRMEARDGSVGFDFEGTYDEIVPLEKLAFSFGDRKAEIRFSDEEGKTRVRVSFDPENENPIEMQRGGWQAILDNFKTHVETH